MPWANSHCTCRFHHKQSRFRQKHWRFQILGDSMMSASNEDAANAILILLMMHTISFLVLSADFRISSLNCMVSAPGQIKFHATRFPKEYDIAIDNSKNLAERLARQKENLSRRLGLEFTLGISRSGFQFSCFASLPISRYANLGRCI
eukprot:Gb_19668 [translate_table: standard]